MLHITKKNHKYFLEFIQCLLAYSFVLQLNVLFCTVTSVNLRLAGKKENLMELLMLEHRKSANTSTFSSASCASISGNWQAFML